MSAPGALRPLVSPGLKAARVPARGEAAWVLSAPMTGRHLRVHPRLRALLGLLDGRRSVAEAVRLLPPARADEPDDAAIEAALPALLRSGVLHLPGRALPEAPRPAGPLAWARVLVFTRLDLGDLGRALPVAGRALGWLFTKPGFALWLTLALTAAALWVSRPAQVAQGFRDALDFGAPDAIRAFVVFTGIKLLHECGHMVAARRMAAAEGHDLRVFRAGVSFMFGMPAPFVDVSGIWLVASRWRRAAVGAAGVQVEVLVASVAGILWAFSAPGPLRDALFQAVLVCGVSSLVFNANPLARLDGYYVLSDLLDAANLSTRAAAALRGFGLAALGADRAPPRDEWGAALYGVASYAYRWVIYAGVFWMAWNLHWTLGTAALLLVGTLFVALPLVLGARAAWRARAVPRAILLALPALALLLVPLPERLVLEGIAEAEGVREVFSPSDGVLERVAAPGPLATGEPALILRNPETARLLRQLDAEARSLVVERRMATPGQLDALLARERANRQQREELAAEEAAGTVAPAGPSVWAPTRAEALRGQWVRRDDARPLGFLLPQDAARTIRLVLDQRDGPRALAALAPGATVPMRPFHDGPARFDAVVTSARPEARPDLPSAALAQSHGGRIPASVQAGRMVPQERVYELRLQPRGTPALAHGARVEAHVPLSPSSLALRLWRAARQALQPRLAT